MALHSFFLLCPSVSYVLLRTAYTILFLLFETLYCSTCVHTITSDPGARLSLLRLAYLWNAFAVR